MPDHDAQGDGIAISDRESTSDSDPAECDGDATSRSTPSAHLQASMELHGPLPPTPYSLADSGSDSRDPSAAPIRARRRTGAADPVRRPAPNHGSGAKSDAGTGIRVLVATFDHDSRRVQAHVAAGASQLLTRTFPGVGLGSPPFRSNPDRKGFDARRSGRKILHDRAARALVGAEVDTLLAGFPPDDRIETGRDRPARRTRHGDVTGTSLTCVDDHEQTPRSESSIARGGPSPAPPTSSPSSPTPAATSTASATR